MKINNYTAFLTGFFVLMVIYWFAIQISGIKTLPINLFYSFATAVLAFFGGVMGLRISRHWGGTKSAVGKAVLLMSLGTTSWSLGNFVWSFCNFVLHTELPYPSLADVGYALAVPLWAVGVFYLSRATGVKFSLRKAGGRVYFILLPLLAAAFSYYFLYVIARGSTITDGGSMLKIFLDFYYPIGDWVILTMSFLVFGLSLQYLGGRLRLPIFITLLGFLAMFAADFSFSYTTTVGTYYNGNYADLLFAVAMYIISFGVDSIESPDS
jgi:hypothetical protein